FDKLSEGGAPLLEVERYIDAKPGRVIDQPSPVPIQGEGPGLVDPQHRKHAPTVDQSSDIHRHGGDGAVDNLVVVEDETVHSTASPLHRDVVREGVTSTSRGNSTGGRRGLSVHEAFDRSPAALRQIFRLCTRTAPSVSRVRICWFGSPGGPHISQAF